MHERAPLLARSMEEWEEEEIVGHQVGVGESFGATSVKVRGGSKLERYFQTIGIITKGGKT